VIGAVQCAGIGILATEQHAGGADQKEKIKMTRQVIRVITLFILCALSSLGYGSNVQQQLQSIPKKDQEILEDFFSYMVSYEYFGYVLFGDKPMAAGGFDTHFTIENTLSEGAAKQRRLRLGWQTWKKYASLFPSEKFILRLSKNPISPSFYWIVIINKDSCLRCIEANLDIFKAVLGRFITPESILFDLATKEDIFKEVLNKHDGLLGILFGYGRHNAMNFQNQKKMSEMLKVIYPKGKRPNMPTNRLSPFNPYNRDLFIIDLPRFAEIPSKNESSQLHISYEETWSNLSRIYAHRQFLEITLKKLTSKF